jgi:hypothetical protein
MQPVGPEKEQVPAMKSQQAPPGQGLGEQVEPVP